MTTLLRLVQDKTSYNTAASFNDFVNW